MINVDHSSVSESQYFSLEDNQDRIQNTLTLFSTLLYGRNDETARLKTAFEELNSCDSSKKIKIFVHGESGSGKTALVETIRDHVISSKGYFVAGKYFQNIGVQEPYSAIMAALSDLCDLVSQSADFTEERRLQIQQDIGVENGRILNAALSNLSPFLEASTFSEDEDSVDIRNTALLSKFMVACKTFLQAFSSKNHVVVLFLDDIQWMDKGSELLLSLLLQDDDLRNVMMILSYRDEDYAKISDFIDKNGNGDAVDIGVKNLDLESVHQLVVDVLQLGNVEEVEFSELVMVKTSGNPFHVMQFIEFVKNEGFLTFNHHNQSWEFDIDQIQSGIMISSDLADLLTMKMTRLPVEVQECLKIASLVGFTFRDDVILCVLKTLFNREKSNQNKPKLPHNYDSLSKALNIALSEGFIEKLRTGYQFSHDKLQAAFQDTLGRNERIFLHQMIGESFAELSNCESNYLAVIHFQHVPDILLLGYNTLQLTIIHYDAAIYCKNKCAFSTSSSFLRRALEFLQEDREMWTVHHNLSFNITLTLAKVEMIIGNHNSCLSLIRIALLYAHSRDSMIDCLIIEIECYMAQNNIDGSIVAANSTLRRLGIDLPRKPKVFHVLRKLLKIQIMLMRKSDDDILNLPPIRDHVLSASIKVLIDLSMYCFMKDEELQGVYTALLAMELTLKHGITPYSAAALAFYGIAELANRNRKRAYRIGKLALELQEKLQCKQSTCSTTSIAVGSLTHWYDPLFGASLHLQNSAMLGFQVGDIVYGAFTLSMSYGMHFVVGTNLMEVEKIMMGNEKIICDLSQDAMAMWTHAGTQHVLNLRRHDVTDWLKLTLLNGERLDESTYFRDALNAKHMILISSGWYCKGMLAFWFGFWAISQAMFQKIMDNDNSFHFAYVGIQVHFFAGVASFASYQETNNRRDLRIARRHMNVIQKLRSKGYPFSKAYLSLLKAEDLAVRKSANFQVVKAAYLTSINAFAIQGLRHLEAFANERLGFYLLELRSLENANSYVRRALHLYHHEWGAIAKCNWLREKYSEQVNMLRWRDGNLVGQFVLSADV